MPVTVNGEVISSEQIHAEENRLRAEEEWRQASDHPEFKMRLRAAAEERIVNRVLLRQAAAACNHPLDGQAVEVELDRQMKGHGCRSAYDARELRAHIEETLRLERVIEAIGGKIALPAEGDLKKFYRQNREKFLSPELVWAAHVVKHIGEGCDEQEALRIIEAARESLDRGTAFASTAQQYSDCREKDGDLGYFSRGVMVPEFEAVVFALQPGERSGIFRTPFGFHIAEVRGRRAPRPLLFEHVRADIEKGLTFVAKTEAFGRTIAVLRQRAVIRRTSPGGSAKRATA